MKPGAQTPSQFPLIRRNDVPPDPALTAMGLTAVSQASGVPADSLFAMVATVLTGLAGPDAAIQDSLGVCRLAKLDLLTNKEDSRTTKLIDRLMSTLEGIQRPLIDRMARNTSVAMELITKGAFSNAKTLKLADQDLKNASLRIQLESLTVTSKGGSESTLLKDLAEDPIPQRVEGMLHPQFLTRGTQVRALSSIVENCHKRCALIVEPNLELAREGPEPSKVVRMLFELLDGATVTKPAATIERGRDSSILAKGHALLAVTDSEIEKLHHLDPGCLDRFLWLKSNNHQDLQPGDPLAIRLLDAYQAAVLEILDVRREGKTLLMTFETEEMPARFDTQLALYESDLQEMGASTQPWARGLPQTLFWALGFLRRSMPAKCRPDDESLMVSSFAAARRLVKNHGEQVLVITNAGLLADRHKLARRIVGILRDANSPQPFREINRGFHRKKKEIVAPLVEALIEVGVLVRDEDGNHTLGPTELADVEEILDRKFAQP
jgi:hypothetical protein